jgi:hypothetical protein
LRVGGGGEYRPLIFFKDAQPVPEIIGVVFPYLRRDAQFRAKKSGSQFGHEFLAGVAVIAETLCAEIPIQPMLGLRPVGQLMQGGRVIALLVLERLEGWKLHRVAGGRIECAVAAMLDGGAGAGDESLRVFDPLRQGQRVCGSRVVMCRQSVDLLDIEYRVLCAVEIYAEHQFGSNDLRVLDQNLLHIIRERSRQRSSMPWQDWKLLRNNTRKAAMQRWVNFYTPMGRS